MLIALALVLAASPVAADDEDFVGVYFAFVDQGGQASTITFKIAPDGTNLVVFDVGPTTLARC